MALLRHALPSPALPRFIQAPLLRDCQAIHKEFPLGHHILGRVEEEVIGVGSQGLSLSAGPSSLSFPI